MIDPTGTKHALSVAAIERAAASTGADFDYLFRTAVRESGLDPKAEAATSSATGLFQFLDQTWLAMMKNHGAEHGFKGYADAISQGRNGKYFVADRQVRQEILALRKDPDVSALMAAEYTAFSADMLRDAKGREPTKGELYAAHFLGPWGAVDMMKAAMRGEPNAAALFPDAARANKPIFYDKAGNPRSPTELLAKLDGMIDGVKTPAVPDLNTIPARQMVAEFRPSMEERQKIVDAQIAASARKELRLERAMPGDDETKAALAVPEIGDAQASITSAIFTQLVASLDVLPTRENDPAFRRERRSDEIFQRAAA